jgi:hypothetical protein
MVPKAKIDSYYDQKHYAAVQSGTAPEFRGGIASLFIAAVLGASCACAAAALSQPEPAPALAETAAATQLFTLKDSLGSEFALSKAKDKPVLVHCVRSYRRASFLDMIVVACRSN